MYQRFRTLFFRWPTDVVNSVNLFTFLQNLVDYLCTPPTLACFCFTGQNNVFSTLWDEDARQITKTNGFSKSHLTWESRSCKCENSLLNFRKLNVATPIKKGHKIPLLWTGLTAIWPQAKEYWAEGGRRPLATILSAQSQRTLFFLPSKGSQLEFKNPSKSVGKIIFACLACLPFKSHEIER